MSLEVEYESSDHDATSQTPINCNMAEEELNQSGKEDEKHDE